MTDDGICLLHTIGSVDPPGPTHHLYKKDFSRGQNSFA